MVEVNTDIVAAVTGLGFKKTSIEGSSLVIDVDDPDKENPKIIESIVKAGGQILFVNDLRPSMEDVYLKLVRK
jgi:ABC-2 type transport system ATP-binding protein